MEKEFIPYEQALALKELGFDEPCFGEYHYGKLNYDKIYNTQTEFHSDLCLAPTFSQCFRWFREKYEMEGITQLAKDFTWYRWEISQYNEDGKAYVANWYEYKTYEEAELECLKKLIEIVKNGK